MNFFLRKICHVLFGLFLLLFLPWSLQRYGLHFTLLLGALVLLLEMLFEFLRVEYKWLSFVASLFKNTELHSFSALTNALAIYIIIFAVFDEALAFAATTIFIFGDAAAALVGRVWGRHRVTIHSPKTWEGFAAFSVVGIVCGLFFVPALLAIPMALVAGILEIRTRRLDDNFFIPLAIAFVGLCLSSV